MYILFNDEIESHGFLCCAVCQTTLTVLLEQKILVYLKTEPVQIYHWAGKKAESLKVKH